MFGPKMFGLPLYLRYAAPSTPIKRGSNSPAYEMRKKKAKEKGGKREKNEEKWGIKEKTTTTTKKNNIMRIHVPTVTPAPWPFASVKFW